MEKSSEFVDFMGNYSVILVKYIEANVKNGIISENELEELQNVFDRNNSFSQNHVQMLADRFNFGNTEDFQKTVDELNNSYIALASKFPEFGNVNYQERFEVVYKEYVHSLLYGNENSISTRDEEPENILFAIDFPRCEMVHGIIEADPEGSASNPNEFCQGWLANSCQVEFNLCVTLAQRDFIDQIIETCSDFGRITVPVIWTDWNVLAGVPRNINGQGGYNLVISFLDTASEGCLFFFMSEPLVAASISLNICEPCIAEAHNDCCD